MKIAPNLRFTVIEPTKKSLETFMQMIKGIYQDFSRAFNGNIGFGDGTNLDNISGSWINVTAPAVANTDFTVNHNLGRIPSGYWVMQKDRACDVYTGSIAATVTQLTLRSTVASAVIRLFIIGLLLCFFSARSEAQGANHTNIALMITTVAGSTGIGGGVVTQPIAGAIITVCNGSTLPASGVTCTGLASIYSNITLTTAISNPTNADSKGNYTFYATSGQSYVISVGGTGLTTYSYVWTAPYTGSINASVLTAGNLNNVQVVGTATGTNASIAAAYTALPSGGGVIYVTAGTYNQALGTLAFSKDVRILCENKATTSITFTGASGVALLWNSGTAGGNYVDWAANGIENCTITGPGSAGTGIQIGDATHANIGWRGQNNIVQSFAIGIANGNLISWGSKCDHCVFANNTQNLSFNLATAGGTENVEFAHTVFTNTSAYNANDVSITGTGLSEVNFTDCSFDNSQVSITNGSNVRFVSSHFEVNSNTTTTPISLSGGAVVSLVNPKFQVDPAAGSVPTNLISASNSNLDIFAPEVNSNSTVTNFVNGTNSGIKLWGLPQFTGVTNIITRSGGWAIQCGDNSQNCVYDLATGKLVLATGTVLQANEGSSPTGVGGSSTVAADSGDHMLKYNPNSSGEQHVPLVVRTTSVYTNATTTPSNITGLSFPVKANTWYTAICSVVYQGSAGTAGLDMTITGPAAPTSLFYTYIEDATQTGGSQDSVSTAFGTKLTGAGTITATTNLPTTVTISLNNGANAGTVQLQGSATGAGTVTVAIGSFCSVF